MSWQRIVRPATSDQLGIVHWYDPEKAEGWLRRVGELSTAAIDASLDAPGSDRDRYDRQITATRNLFAAIDGAYKALNIRPQTDPYWVAIGDRKFAGKVFCTIPPGMTAEQFRQLTLALPDVIPYVRQVGGTVNLSDGRVIQSSVFTRAARQVVGWSDPSNPDVSAAPALSGRSWTADMDFPRWFREHFPAAENPPVLSSPRDMFRALRATALALVARNPQRIIEDAYDFSGLQRTWILARSGARDTADLADQFARNEANIRSVVDAGGFRMAGGAIAGIGSAMMSAGGPIGLVGGAILSAVGALISLMRGAAGDCYDEQYWRNNLPLYTNPAVHLGRNDGTDPPGPSVQIPVPPAPASSDVNIVVSPIERVYRELSVAGGSGVSWYQRREVKIGGVVIGSLALGSLVAYLMRSPKKARKR